MRSPAVVVRRETVIIPTYRPFPGDKNPMFLEKRVYQGSSGQVYPLPFTNRIAEESVAQAWDAIVLENEFVEIMILPQIGGRIHAARDKTNGYDFFYRQEVIKPALVGLAGPWISGGVEFNWPQHHRPATFLPVDTEIEYHRNGSLTVWCSDHDPLQRMKGMHGVCIHPDRSVVEVKVRAYNRTALTQTFLWWANVATKVHEGYQSFFPPDVDYVADHARRSMSAYPVCEGHYYGVDYAKRALHGVPPAEAPAKYVPPASGGQTPIDYPANDLSFYANIPVPTSYMCMGSEEDFFGGYDHTKRAGVLHIANHHIAPGKKQWTWGNHEFGYAWDRNLTDADGNGECAPYIEIMAGVYTDNQPDFSFLLPGETKTWSQFWYPIREVGTADHATVDAALSLRVDGRSVRLGLSVSRRFSVAHVRLEKNGKTLAEFCRDISPEAPFAESMTLKCMVPSHALRLVMEDAAGNEVIAYAPQQRERKPVPPPACEPPAPSKIASNDELHITGQHLAQYRHATRSPVPYWREALQRDPGDSRCNTALGIWHLRRGEFTLAEAHLRQAIQRLTSLNANPSNGEAHYHLGLTLRHLGRESEAYAAFYKAVWNQEWQAAGYFALAQIDCLLHRWETALDHLNRSLRMNTDHLGARNLLVMVYRRQGSEMEANSTLEETRRMDRLDWWSRHLSGEPINCDTQTRLDLALDHAAAGFLTEASDLLRRATPVAGTAPLVQYYIGWFEERLGNRKAASQSRRKAAKSNPDYCFPARLEEIAILESSMVSQPGDALAPYLLGNLLYDRRRHAEAIRLWELSAKLNPSYPVVWRNLGIAYFNIRRQSGKARMAYEKAFRANPDDARLLYERDQLWKRIGESPAKRLRILEKHRHLVGQRDDLSVEICALYNQIGLHENALAVLTERKFQPWEGGEGQALGQHVRTHLALGRKALGAGDAIQARGYFEAALTAPQNLAESRQLLANASDIHYWLGLALEKLGDKAGARAHWKIAAEARGDFQEMSVRVFSEMTYYSALAMQKLGRTATADKLLRGLMAHARKLAKAKAGIDYFATSLPTLLLFDDDLQARQTTTARFLEAQALLALGRKASAHKLLAEVQALDPNHSHAADLLLL